MITLDEVIEIKEQYQHGLKSRFLCIGSKTFDKLWATPIDKKELSQLGTLFLTEINNTTFKIGVAVMFSPILHSVEEEDLAIRELFLEWWIAKLTKDSTPT